jgi:hypothetical protein
MTSELIHMIKLRQAEIGVSLASGNASTWESYQRMVGENVGLAWVLQMINQKLEEEDRG